MLEKNGMAVGRCDEVPGRRIRSVEDDNWASAGCGSETGGVGNPTKLGADI